MTTLSIFVVEGHTGEYSDRSEWNVAAMPTREAADALLLECENWAIANRLFRHRRGTQHWPQPPEPPILAAVKQWITNNSEHRSVVEVTSWGDELDWTDRWDWRNAVRGALAAGVIKATDPRVGECDSDGVDYVVVEVKLSITDRDVCDAFLEQLIVLRAGLPAVTE